MQTKTDPQVPDAILVPALRVGAVSGGAGFLAGGLIALVRSSPTVGLFASGTGLNCFALGACYSATRSTIFKALRDPDSRKDVPLTPKEKLYASGIAGALTGLGMGLVLRGRSNAIPGAIVWGLLGLGGQHAYNVADSRHTYEVEHEQPLSRSFSDRIFRSEWSPIKKLNDYEYTNMLNGKILALDAEIAITDEEIEKLKKDTST